MSESFQCLVAEKTTVSVALATDEFYLSPTLVAVRSIALHTSDCYHYVIYILSEKPLSFFSQRLFSSAVKGYENVNIVFINVGHMISTVNLSVDGPIKGVTQATFFRFLLPDLLKATNKVLYLDSDTLVLDDIAKVYLKDIDGFLMGGVRDHSGQQDSETRCRELGIDSLDQYVNAGVLLMNLKELRRVGLSEKMLTLAAERSFSYNDQDIINAMCYGRILAIPYKCNAIVDYLEDPIEISQTLGIDYMSEISDPVVLHYAGRAKPWYHPTNKWSLLWWQIARTFRGNSALLFKYYFKKLQRKNCS